MKHGLPLNQPAAPATLRAPMSGADRWLQDTAELKTKDWASTTTWGRSVPWS